MSVNGWRTAGGQDGRPTWRMPAFWLVLAALLLPFGWLLFVYAAGRHGLRGSSARRRPPSLLPLEYAEWLRLRDERRAHLRSTAAPHESHRA